MNVLKIENKVIQNIIKIQFIFGHIISVTLELSHF